MIDTNDCFGLGADLPALLVLITDQAARPRHGVDGSYAQIATFAKSAFRPGNTALDRCDAALKAVIDERCGGILVLEVSSADGAAVNSSTMKFRFLEATGRWGMMFMPLPVC